MPRRRCSNNDDDEIYLYEVIFEDEFIKCFKQVSVEECNSTFVTTEEMDEMTEGLGHREYSHGDYILNSANITAEARKAIADWKKKPDSKKSIACPIDFKMYRSDGLVGEWTIDSMSNTFNDTLKKAGLTRNGMYVKVWKDPETKPAKVLTDAKRSFTIHAVNVVRKKYDLDITIKSLHELENMLKFFAFLDAVKVKIKDVQVHSAKRTNYNHWHPKLNDTQVKLLEQYKKDLPSIIKEKKKKKKK